MKTLDVTTRRGTVLNGVLFPAQNSDTVVIAITGIHGNFYSNPFYYNIGDTLSAAGIKPAKKKLSNRGTKDFPIRTKILTHI